MQTKMLYSGSLSACRYTNALRDPPFGSTNPSRDSKCLSALRILLVLHRKAPTEGLAMFTRFDIVKLLIVIMAGVLGFYPLLSN